MADVYREREVPQTETVPAPEAAPVSARAEHRKTLAEQIVYLIGGILIGLLAIRFILSLLGANRENGFANLIYTLSHPFASPFFGLFNYKEQFGVSRFEIETLVAIAVYALVMAVLARLVTLGSRR